MVIICLLGRGQGHQGGIRSKVSWAFIHLPHLSSSHLHCVPHPPTACGQSHQSATCTTPWCKPQALLQGVASSGKSPLAPECALGGVATGQPEALMCRSSFWACFSTRAPWRSAQHCAQPGSALFEAQGGCNLDMPSRAILHHGSTPVSFLSSLPAFVTLQANHLSHIPHRHAPNRRWGSIYELNKMAGAGPMGHC